MAGIHTAAQRLLDEHNRARAIPIDQRTALERTLATIGRSRLEEIVRLTKEP
ncbi:MAG: hypothetical protein AAGF45_11545 [Pseudomonadota bacterium]